VTSLWKIDNYYIIYIMCILINNIYVFNLINSIILYNSLYYKKKQWINVIKKKKKSFQILKYLKINTA